MQQINVLNEKTNEEHEEHQYLRLIQKVIQSRAKKSNRTGVDTYSIFGAQMRFSLRDGKCNVVPTRIFIIEFIFDNAKIGDNNF